MQKKLLGPNRTMLIQQLLLIVFFIFQISYLNAQNPDYYPMLFDASPGMPSPFVTDDGTEVITAQTKSGQFTLIPVTVENGKPLLYSRRINSLYGKDSQLLVNRGEFPTLAKTGLHSEAELSGIERITDIPVEIINCTARPNCYSYEGFLAEDEDIISALKGDNYLVQEMGLTHPQLAKPLFHVWNIILWEFEVEKFGRFTNMQSFLYNVNSINLRAESTKGWQVSIFQDEIQGRFNIQVKRDLTDDEKKLLNEKYADLTVSQFTELVEKLSKINFSEMLPYYIMRYGFYEGHTGYRADPLAITFIFNLLTLEEIENAFPHKIYNKLTTHFIQ